MYRGVQSRLRSIACRRLRAFSANLAAAAFSPYTLDSFTNIWKGDAQAYNNGDPVSTFAASKGAVNFTMTGSNRPTFVSSAKNGLPALYFSGASSQKMSSTFGMSQPGTIFVVFAYDASAAGFVFDGLTDPSRWGFWLNSGKLNFFSSTTDVAGATTITTGDWYIAAVRPDGASGKLWLNGALDATGNGGSSAMANMVLGYRGPTSNNYFTGHIAEVLAGTPSAQEIADTFTFLGSKYAITVA